MPTSVQDSNFNTAVKLKRGREHSFKKGHHWIFSGSVESVEGEPNEGELVQIVDFKSRKLGYGFYGTKSITVRVLSFDNEKSPQEKILDLLKQARKKRKKLGLTSSEITDSYRLFHSEGDYLPGLTIDKLNDIIVIQAHHVGILAFLKVVTTYLLQKFPNTKSIVLKSGASKESKDNYEFIFGEDPVTIITENNLKFKINVLEGQKTGFFLDQRTNREELAEVARGKSVLNLFCYSGGFSIYALKNEAIKVISVDSSNSAILNAKENDKLLINISGIREYIEDDCLKFLNEHTEKFDIVVCDPPALVKSRRDLHKGLRYYFDLQKQALLKVNNGGLFFSFSCSQFVSEKDLLITIEKAGKSLGVRLSLIKKLFQAPCHTINPKHLESLYLKGFIFQVDA